MIAIGQIKNILNKNFKTLAQLSKHWHNFHSNKWHKLRNRWHGEKKEPIQENFGPWHVLVKAGKVSL